MKDLAPGEKALMAGSDDGVLVPENGHRAEEERKARDKREKETDYPEQQQRVSGCLF